MEGEALPHASRERQEHIHEEDLTLLSRDRISELEDLWTQETIDRQVQKTIEGLLAPEPDSALVRLVKKKTDPPLTPKELKAALARLRVRFGKIEPPSATAPEAGASKEDQGKAPPGAKVTLGDLIKAELVKPPLQLRRTYKGKTLTALVQADGRVTFQGKSYSSVSMAAAMARNSVIGPPPGGKYHQTNGWTFWKFEDEGSGLKELDVLRQRLLEKSAPLMG